MMSKEPDDRPSGAALEYERLLVTLASVMAAKGDDSQEADRVRDEMGRPWATMSEPERALLRSLSADLYLIEGERLVTPLAEGETIASVREQLKSAFMEGRDRDALTLARKLPEPESRMVYVIGRCWDRLGFFQGAVCFYDFAYKQDPKSVFAISALEALVHGNQIAEAVSRAEEIEGRTNTEAMLLLQAASVLYRAAATLEAERRPAMYERIVKMVETGSTDAAALPSVRANGLLAAGFSYEHLGRSGDALRAFERAVAIYPTEAPLLAYGLALLKTNRRQAIAQFTAAAAQHTQLDWPYLYAAQSALEEARYRDAKQFCELGLQRTGRAELRGRFYEWSAIAAVNLERPAEEVRELFDRALAELPFDTTIPRNAAAFAESSAHREWKVEPTQDTAAPTVLTFERAAPAVLTFERAAASQQQRPIDLAAAA